MQQGFIIISNDNCYLTAPGKVPWLAGCGAEAGALLINSSFLEDPPVLLGMKIGESTQSKPTIAAKIQVPFSSTSVVCLTPMN